MTLNELAQESHQLAKEKGWYDTDRSFPELIALCHSELSEALEDFRFGRDIHWVFLGTEKVPKPEGVVVELADLIIRVCDMAGFYGMDLDKAVEVKMAYNRTRPYRHGNKRA